MRALIAIAALLPCLAHAWGAELHGRSYHREHGEYNENNHGVGAWAARGELFGHAGVYRNSYSRTSVYATVEWLPMRSTWLDAGVGGGLASGYHAPERAPNAYLVARLKVSDNAYFALRGIPPLPGVTRGMAMLSLGYAR